MRTLGCTLVLLGWAAVALAADPPADAWSKSVLGKATLGDLWMGPAVEMDDLRGRVVLLEFWGYRCGPCIAAMPHLSKLNRTYASHGLTVIGAHAQGPAKAEAVAIAIRQKVNYTILSKANVPGKMSFRGIPKVFVFDHTGAVVFDGHPADKAMEQAIVGALKRRPHPLLGEMKYTAMRAVATDAKAGRLGRAWKACEKKADAEGRAGEEAKYLLANLKRYADRQKRRAEKQQTEAPAKCLATWQELNRRYVGTEIAEQAGSKLKELAADKAFQAELKAERAYHPISIAFGKVPTCPKDGKARTLWQARWGGAARQIKARVDALKKQYPDSHFAAKAEKKYNEMVGAK